MDEHQKLLVTENHNLIYSFLRKYNLDVDEYYDLAAIGLCNACITYDASYKVPLSTYAYKCMFNSLFSYTRSGNVKFNKSCISYNQTIPSTTSQVENLEIIDMLEDAKLDIERDCISLSMLYEYIDTIKNQKHAEILRYIVENENPNQRDIGKKFGYSQSYVSRILKTFKKGYQEFCNT